jgi:hypothetical protein
MKTLIILIVILMTLCNAVNVQAASYHATGDSRHEFFDTKQWTSPHHEKSVLMQDLNQCVLVNGQVLCIDICGGRSIPGTVCSYE